MHSFVGRQGVAYRHIILLAVSLKFSKTLPPKSPKIAVVDNPNCGLTPAPKGTAANIRMNLIFSETRFIGLHFCRSNSRSRSFKVIHFAISYRPPRGIMSPYNTARLISEDSEEVATQIAKNYRRRQPHSHLTPPPRGTPTNIPCINLIFPETRIIGLHFCR